MVIKYTQNSIKKVILVLINIIIGSIIYQKSAFKNKTMKDNLVYPNI